MLEKIGLPPKPSMRGGAWVIDASHCQGCASQFTFFNRKHHCRRCGGIFCNNCTINRMFLRGQGDSPVRICDPCKRLEEAARFELRHGHRNRAVKGGPKLDVKNEDELLNQNHGTEIDSDLYRTVSSSSSMHEEAHGQNRAFDAIKSSSVNLTNEVGSSSPEELRQRALEEKKKYKILNGEGKREEALQAFKRGKELERHAVALETASRKSRRKAMASASSSISSTQKIIDGHDECASKSKNSSQKGKEEKDELAAQLRELGWTEADLVDADKKPVKLGLEGELSNLLGEIPQRSAVGKQSSEANKARVLAHKKQALMFKREGKLAEATEELKKAKVMEKQIEEEEFLVDAESSDDELSALIRSMDEHKSFHDDFTMDYGNDIAMDLNHLNNMPGDLTFDDDFEVTEEDLNDPAMVSALKSFGWDEEPDQTADKEALQREVLSLKREALNLKRAGDIEEAMACLKKAKLREKDLEKLQSLAQTNTSIENGLVSQAENRSTPFVKTNVKDLAPPKSKLVIQRELIGMKKKALALRREGRIGEADEELKKAKVLELQLEELQNAPKVAPNGYKLEPELENHEFVSGDKDKEKEEDVTEQDLRDPAYLQVLKSMGWEEEGVGSQKLPYPNDELIETAVMPNPSKTPVRAWRSKAEIQRELLGIKRKALALRRQGKQEEAEEELKMAKVLEAQVTEMDKAGGSNDKATSVSEPLTIQEEPAREIFDTDSKEPELAKPFISCLKETQNSEHYPGVNLDNSQLQEDKYQSFAKKGQLDTLCLVKNVSSQAVQSVVTEDFLTALDRGISHLPIQRPEGEGNSCVNNISLTETKGILDMSENSRESENCQEEKSSRRISDGSAGTQEERLPAIEDVQARQETNSRGDQSSLRQDILGRKRKALFFKREGKLAEAREELRQAKTLEKSLEQDDTHSSVNSSKDVAVPLSSNISVIQENKTNVDQKPISSRDRFKLQQQCLAHKRQALKLRREGKIQESEAESELAKAIETQLEEMAALDSNATGKGPVDDVAVDDFLDPQLLTALKSIGWQDSDIVVQTTETQATLNAVTSRKINEEKERSQLEEEIKTERAQALNLKRAGKQTEALNSLRRAKQLEKKLNSLAS
ncbi:uncharacterized protein [Aristolochia californica]|uniref:uncharacterized protein n=1 Tax=Aristolochia californica TaxID=171875 RepID=UPI0035DFC19C